MMLAATLLLLLGAAPPAKHFTESENCEVGEYGTTCKGSIEDVPYSYYLTKDGTVDNGVIDGPTPPPSEYLTSDDPDRWVINTQHDKMEDSISWFAFQYKTGLMLGLNPTGQIRFVCILNADFPGRPIAIRVGTATPLRFEERCASGPLLELRKQLMRGGRLLTRGTRWPYDYPVDREGRADNFDKLLKLYAFLRSY